MIGQNAQAAASWQRQGEIIGKNAQAAASAATWTATFEVAQAN